MVRKVIWSAVLAVSVAGCGGMASTSATQPLVVDNKGARIETPSGLGRLDIPKDALQAQVEVRLVETFDDKGRHEIEIQPNDLKFAKPAKLTFKMPDPAIRPELEHAVEVEVQNQVEVEVEVRNQVCDVMEREIQAQLDHAGRFRREDRPL